MITALAELYRAAAIQLFTEEMLGKREKTITNIIAKKKQEWFLDCVRMYLQKPVEDTTFPADFVKTFQEDDALFESDGNQMEQRTLAAAIISEFLKKKREKNDDRTVIALAVITGKFSIPHSSIVNFTLVEQAHAFLQQEAKNKRNTKELRSISVADFPSFVQTAGDITKIDAFLKDFSDKFQAFVKKIEVNDLTLKRKVFVLEEESDIHWWLFRRQSTLLNSHLSAIDADIAPLAIAWELWSLTRISPAPANYLEFIKNAFTNIVDADNTTPSVAEAINATYSSDLFTENKQLFSDLGDYNNLTPLLFALRKAAESGGDDGWTAAFKYTTKSEPDATFSRIDLATQMYLELLLVKSPLE